MKLYLHTPYYKNSDFMAHLCEHLVLHPGHRILSQTLKSSPRIISQHGKMGSTGIKWRKIGKRGDNFL